MHPYIAQEDCPRYPALLAIILLVDSTSLTTSVYSINAAIKQPTTEDTMMDALNFWLTNAPAHASLHLTCGCVAAASLGLCVILVKKLYQAVMST